MKSSYPRLRAIRPTRCNPILTATTIREIAEHNGAMGFTQFRDERGYGVVLIYSVMSPEERHDGGHFADAMRYLLVGVSPSGPKPAPPHLRKPRQVLINAA